MSPTDCVDCGIDTCPLGWDGEAEFYKVHDAVWAEVGMVSNGGMLCVGCIEQRLGRRLTPDDFTDAPINDPELYRIHYAWSWRTQRLQDRLTGR
jgi:hypothetical protein